MALVTGRAATGGTLGTSFFGLPGSEARGPDLAEVVDDVEVSDPG